ncbi:MAG: protein kinase [Verrucomicrobiae bacterium]|nr:protein kinase [Verrucomicrobiae bacterium]
MSPRQDLVSCPQCGGLVKVAGSDFNVMVRCDQCGAIFRQDDSAISTDAMSRYTAAAEPSPSPEPTPVPPPADSGAEQRTASCPHCQTLMEVPNFNPLDEGICPTCNKTFEVLRQFGHYQIQHRLDVGGQGVVYRAVDLQNNNLPVALKVLSADAFHQPGAKAAFRREYELTRNLSHPNLIQIFEHGMVNGFEYLALELVEGLSVSQIMNLLPPLKPRKGTQVPENDFQSNLVVIPEEICLEIALQAAAGLGAAHQANLVHGDVKPANFMISKDGVVKVLDFGLVQFANVEQLFVENEQDQIFGTAFYIPPERVRGEKEDFRSDIYGLGATLFHMLAGRAPFYAKTLDQIAMMHVQDSLTSFRGRPVLRFSVNSPQISEHTVHMIEKALKKEPRERYSSHIEFIADLMLAKNQWYQANNRKTPKESQAVLRRWLRTVPGRGLFSSFWRHVRVIVNNATSAITVSITRKMRLRGGKEAEAASNSP